MSFDDDVERDIEAAMDRDALSWQRSSLALAAVALLLVRHIEPIASARPLLSVLLLVMAGLFAGVGEAYHRLREHAGEPTRRIMLAVSAGTMLVGVLAFVVVAIEPR